MQSAKQALIHLAVHDDFFPQVNEEFNQD